MTSKGEDGQDRMEQPSEGIPESHHAETYQVPKGYQGLVGSTMTTSKIRILTMKQEAS